MFRSEMSTVTAMRLVHPHAWRDLPSHPLAEWRYLLEEFVGDESAKEWGFAAASYIDQVRRTTALGPTFSELFEYLLPDTSGRPGPYPPGWGYQERQRALSSFRVHALMAWRRRFMVNWEQDVARSLRVGKQYRSRLSLVEHAQRWRLS